MLGTGLAQVGSAQRRKRHATPQKREAVAHWDCPRGRILLSKARLRHKTKNKTEQMRACELKKSKTSAGGEGQGLGLVACMAQAKGILLLQ